jgi:hypothetical protein
VPLLRVSLTQEKDKKNCVPDTSVPESPFNDVGWKMTIMHEYYYLYSNGYESDLHGRNTGTKGYTRV